MARLERSNTGAVYPGPGDPGPHSGQGSIIPGITREVSLKKMGSDAARLFAENLDARLAGIVIGADPPYDDQITRGA